MAINGSTVRIIQHVFESQKSCKNGYSIIFYEFKMKKGAKMTTSKLLQEWDNAKRQHGYITVYSTDELNTYIANFPKYRFFIQASPIVGNVNIDRPFMVVSVERLIEC